jgi:chromosome segregation ATPase
MVAVTARGNDRQQGREPMARSLRLARGAVAILAIGVLAMAGRAEAAPPPYPDTSAVGTVPAMSQKLAVAKSELDKVEAQLAALRQKSDALTRTQLARQSDAGKLTAQADQMVKDWNQKVEAFNASCGNRLQMHDPDWTNCFHWQTELNDTKGSLTALINILKSKFNEIKQQFDRDRQQQLSYEHDTQELTSWKSQTSAGIQSLEAAIQTKCKPQHNCPSS